MSIETEIESLKQRVDFLEESSRKMLDMIGELINQSKQTREGMEMIVDILKLRK